MEIFAAAECGAACHRCVRRRRTTHVQPVMVPTLLYTLSTKPSPILRARRRTSAAAAGISRRGGKTRRHPRRVTRHHRCRRRSSRARHTDTPTADHDPAPSRPPTTTDEPRRTAGGRWELSSALGIAEQSCQITACTYTSSKLESDVC